MKIQIPCPRCHEEVEIPGDATLIPEAGIPGHVCLCHYCDHPQANHEKRGSGFACNGVSTRHGSRCTDCQKITDACGDLTTTIGMIWATIAMMAENYWLPGAVPVSEWEHNTGRAEAWADGAILHIALQLERNRVD